MKSKVSESLGNLTKICVGFQTMVLLLLGGGRVGGAM